MAYTANQYNYATPLSSGNNLFSASSSVLEKHYFTLFDNKLDGSYVPVSGDVGLWGNILSDDEGNLSIPYVLRVNAARRLKSFRLTGSVYCYPVSFVVKFYNNDTALYTISESANKKVEYTHHFDRDLIVTSYTISIAKVSKANAVARVYNVYEPTYMSRYEKVRVALNSLSALEAGETIAKHVYDTIPVGLRGENSHVRSHAISSDALRVVTRDESTPHNIHSVMKSASRRVYGKVYITYTDPMLNSDTAVTSETTAYNSVPRQVLDGIKTATGSNLFTLYDNNLSGNFVVSDDKTQVGWSSSVLSGTNGYFDVPPVLMVRFASRPVLGLPIVFNDAKGCVAEDFSVKFIHSSGVEIVKVFTGNTNREVVITTDALVDVVAIEITFYKASKPRHPASVLELPVASTVLYTGYRDESNLISIDLLEELTYEDEVEALGGVSANEITVMLDNSNKDFYFNNKQSIVASQLKRNRKIVPWLGAEINPGEIEWYTLGTFWSYRWDVPVNGLTATVVGFDTIGLLDTTSFTKHHVQINKSIGKLIEYVLDDAATTLDFIEYVIDPALYDIIIPYAWFAPGSHTAALRKISGCYPMHIYCDRQGRICAMPQKLRLDYYYDTWSDSTNVIDKSYSSLYTTLPNIINVTVVAPLLVQNEELAKDDRPFNVSGTLTRTLNFSKPYVSNINVSVDTTVKYSYEVYSWGIVITFNGTGTVNSIVCIGTAIDTSNASVISSIDEESVHVNGSITRDIQSDFIQRAELADTIIGRIQSLAAYDKYDAQVNYRGDIALTINDPILLLDGIAPDNRYNIKRHQLFWNGSLTGSADLNT